jgi:hypothetical protein
VTDHEIVHEPDEAVPEKLSPALGLAGETAVERILTLQRTAGNAAVGRLLARQQTSEAPDPFAPAPLKPPDRVVVTDLRYVCMFVGHDLYGTQARRFARFAMKGHKRIEAGSLQQAFAVISADAHAASRTAPVRIDEIVLVAHGHPSGFIKIPLVPGQKGTTVAELKKLQDQFQAGDESRMQFAAARREVIKLLDAGSSIIVRGCRAGRAQALVDALTLFFGGQAAVYVPKEFQGFTRMRIGGAIIPTRVAAYDFLEEKGFVEYGTADTDEQKDRWVRKNLPDGYVPEMFFVAEEEAEKVRYARADDPGIQDFKDYASALQPGDYESEKMHGRAPWGVGRWGPGLDDDLLLDPLSPEEIVERAAEHLAKLRATEAGTPDDWRTIGEEAWWVLRCHSAWARHAQPIDGSPDPIGGLWMPGLSYDTDVLSMQSSRRPDLRAEHTDAFFAVPIQTPTMVPVEEAEEFDAGGGLDARARDVAAAKAREQAKAAHPTKNGGPVLKDGVLNFPAGDPADVITPVPGMPRFPPSSLDLDKGPGASTGPAPLGGGVRPANFKRKIPLKASSAPSDGYFQLRGVEIGLDGYVEWGAKGEREVAVAQLFSYEPGKPYSAGFKGDVKLAETKSGSGWYLKWKGGFETTELQNASEKGKWEISTALEWGNGPYVGELKVFCSYDSVKGELRIGGVKISPAGVQGEFNLPLADGTSVKFKGKALLSADIQPNWPKVAQRLGLRFAGAAVEGAAVGAGATTIATGFAAIGAAEAIVLGGAVVGTGALLYAYYRAVKDWQDIKEVGRVAEQASADVRAGFASAFGLPDKTDGPLFAKGGELGHVMSSKMAERMVKGWESQHPGQSAPFSVQDAEAFTNDQIGASPGLTSGVRQYAFGAFHKWVMAEFYRQWRSQHAGELTLDHNDKYARTYLGLSDIDAPPHEPDWTFVPKPESQVVETPF